VSSDYRAEMRGFLLITCFVLVVPLILFPKDLGLKIGLSVSLLAALELCWYGVVLLASFPKEPASRVFPLILLTMLYRASLGVGFGILLVVMFSLSVGPAMGLGIYHYAPAFVLQVIMAPFVLKPLFALMLKRRPRVVGFETQGSQEAQFAVPEATEAATESRRTAAGEKEPKMATKVSLEGVLHYLREYSGVKAALLVDPEGLVLACDCTPDFDAELIASYSRHLKQKNDQVLKAMGEGKSERITIHTRDVWMSFHQIGEFTLVVRSLRRTDELLSVRITQSISMIEKFLAEKYRLNTAESVEA
jgi:predicted regulator of Ras-like GTPase activity (Roadblock/LC7/MglB family)